VLVSPLSPAKSMVANSPGAASKEVKSPLVKPDCDFEDARIAAAAIVSDLRTRTPASVLAEVMRVLHARHAEAASENIPPTANTENASVASTCWQDAKSNSGLPSLPQLRTEIQRISTDAVRALLPGPEAAEVRALLRRVEALMRSEGTNSCCTADVAR